MSAKLLLLAASLGALHSAYAAPGDFAAGVTVQNDCYTSVEVSFSTGDQITISSGESASELLLGHVPGLLAPAAAQQKRKQACRAFM